MNIEARIPRREEEGRNGLTELTEFECHDCGMMIEAEIDLSVNGNHVIICPCGHEHCRVVRNGRITSARWDQRNGPVPVSTTAATWSTTATTSSITTSSTSTPQWISTTGTSSIWITTT